MFLSGLFYLFAEKLLFLVGYVSGNSTFPSPLSPAEESRYLALYKNGDQNARNILIERNLRLVAHIAKKYGDDNTMDDLISIGTIGLIKGVDTFNFDKNKRLSAYISRCIENEVLMHLRSNKKRMNDVSIDEKIGTDKDGNAMTYSDVLTADQEDFADRLWLRQEEERLEEAMKICLSPVESELICMRFGLGNTKKITQREIAEKMGISRSYVSRIEKKCLKKLSETMKNS